MENNPQSQIKHVVVMMFENRSFDHMLGDMPNVNGLFDANGVLKPDIYNSTTPFQHVSNPQLPFPITPGAVEAEYIPNYYEAPSFNHDFTAMLTNLYGPGTTGVNEGSPISNTNPTYPPTNSGYIYSNDFLTGNSDDQQYSVMSYFKWNSLQVFHTLASQFVVCDNWFCDMPGHTAPNRAFMHCATTGALGIDDNDAANESYPIPDNPSMVYKPTIFETLEAACVTWKMYWPGSNLDTDFLNLNVANAMWTAKHPQQANRTGVPLTQFCSDAASGNLPFYSFIMCWNDVGGDTSMHPQTPVEAGENLLAGVYNALRNSPCWPNTLLVVNFDENGGIYDHVTPPATVPPYPGASPDYWPLGTQDYQFDYSILGVRIPVLLISPWLNAGVDSTQFQNTSVLRYLQDLVAPPPANTNINDDNLPTLFLTERDRNANSIALTFETLGAPVMRTDCIQSVPTYPHNTFADGICAPIFATPEQLAATPPLYLQQLTREYIAGLPGHPDSHKPITMHFETVTEMRSYVDERRTAARAYYKRILGR